MTGALRRIWAIALNTFREAARIRVLYGIVLLVMPVFLPIILKLPPEEIGWLGHVTPDQVAIWFGVTFCMNMQVSFLSPPFGPAAFYLKSVAPENITLTAIFAGFLPFIIIQLIALAVMLAWPPIVSMFL